VVLEISTKSHDFLNTGSVVPAAIKQNNFTARRQFSNIALEIPFTRLSGGWNTKSNYMSIARTQMLSNSLNCSILTGGVTPLKNDQELSPASNNVSLGFY
jgi:hypothetical protein